MRIQLLGKEEIGVAMIILYIIVGYVFAGLIAGKLTYNSLLNEEYELHLVSVAKERRKYNAKWDETLEEAALRCATEKLSDDDSTIFWVGLAGWFWPITLILVTIYYAWEVVSWTAKKMTFLQSASERTVKKIVAEKERKKLLDQQELEIKEERQRLIILAKELDMKTQGLEDAL